MDAMVKIVTKLWLKSTFYSMRTATHFRMHMAVVRSEPLHLCAIRHHAPPSRMCTLMVLSSAGHPIEDGWTG